MKEAAVPAGADAAGLTEGTVASIDVGAVPARPEYTQPIQVTLSRILTIRTTPMEWRCFLPRCDHAVEFRLARLDRVPNRIVLHWLRDHGLAPEDIVAIAPMLEREVRNCCEVLGVNVPAEARAGTFTTEQKTSGCAGA